MGVCEMETATKVTDALDISWSFNGLVRGFH